jgi:hypothetical protein
MLFRLRRVADPLRQRLVLAHPGDQFFALRHIELAVDKGVQGFVRNGLIHFTLLSIGAAWLLMA